jgi:uncharacterized membrane protein
MLAAGALARVLSPALATAGAAPLVGAPSTRPIRSLVVLDVPIETAWAAISDIPAQPSWMREMKAVRLLTPGPVGVGTIGEADVRILGVGITDPVEITAWEPPTRFEIRHRGRFAGRGDIRLRAGADGTTTIAEWTEVLVPPLLPELGSLAQRPILSRIFQDDLHRFRRLVTAGDLPRDR